MYIKRLTIKNFKSHKKTNIKLHKHVNVIAPKSESNPNMIGKTNIIRALYWLCYNRPMAAYFYSNFAGSKQWASVRALLVGKNQPALNIKLSKRVSYTKTGDRKIIDAIYKVNTDKYRKFGSKVPDTVIKALNMGDINFAQQMDEPFLITSSRSQISKEINLVTKLDEVDNWLTDLNSRIRHANMEIEEQEKNIERLRSKLKSYSGVKNIGILLKNAERLDRQIKALQKENDSLENDIADYKESNAAAEEAKDLLSYNQVKLIKQLKVVYKEIESLTVQNKLLEKPMLITVNINDLDKELNLYKEKYAKQLLKRKKCPTCGKPITKKSVQQILEVL